MRGVINRTWTFLSAVGIGAGIMYMLDPDAGNRRRALARDQLVRTGNKTGDSAGKAIRDLGNRARGFLAETRARLCEERVPDEVVVERVKAKLGHHDLQIRALDITSEGGRVRLRGAAPAERVDELVSTVSCVRGVKGVENRLEVREQSFDAGAQGAAIDGAKEPRANGDPGR